MSQHLDRAQLLLQQGRHELALRELQQHLADDPDNPFVHATLSLTLTELKRYQEAMTEAQSAVHLAPDVSFTHFALARVYYDRNRLREALAAIEEAIRLDPEEADNYSLLAAIRFDQKQWSEALRAADEGLALDPDHVTCTNLRAMALVKLGRKDQAGETIDEALSRNPENALTHANQGWTLLEKRQPQKAMEHFREALRLDPELEWARAGIVEAMKARNILYRVLLGYFLWMAKLSTRAQWGIIIGGFFGARVLRSMARANPDLAPFVAPLLILYVAFAVMTWIADPLFNLVLRTSRFGRLALSREQIRGSNWLAACALAAASFCVIGLTVESPQALVAALACGLMMVPVSAIYRCRPGWPRWSISLYCAALATLGLIAAAPPGWLPGGANPLADFASGTFMLGIFASTWIANLLIAAPVRY